MNQFSDVVANDKHPWKEGSHLSPQQAFDFLLGSDKMYNLSSPHLSISQLLGYIHHRYHQQNPASLCSNNMKHTEPLKVFPRSKGIKVFLDICCLYGNTGSLV